MKFNVPKEKQLYQLEKDFYGYNAGSICSINYPSVYGGFTFSVYKKYNKNSPAIKFGSEALNISGLNTLDAVEYKE